LYDDKAAALDAPPAAAYGERMAEFIDEATDAGDEKEVDEWYRKVRSATM
jgi:hypothetical protein